MAQKVFVAMSINSIISKYILIYIAKKPLVKREQNVKTWMAFSRLA